MIQMAITIKMPQNLGKMSETLIVKAMSNSVDKLLVIGKEAAIERYLEKRISKKTTSKLIDSFKYETPTVSGVTVTGKIFAGGPDAPHAPFVDELGWDTKKGHKKGYKIMEAGVKAIEKKAYSVNFDEFRKVIEGGR